MRKMGDFEFLSPTETWHFFLCDLIALVDKWPLKIYQEERKGGGGRRDEMELACSDTSFQV